MKVKVEFKNWFSKKNTFKTLDFNSENDFMVWKNKNINAKIQSQAKERIIGYEILT